MMLSMDTQAQTVTQETLDLIQDLPEEIQDKVLRGEVIAAPGKLPGRPILRDAKTGALTKGTGHAPGAGEIGALSPRHAYKRTNAYRELLQHIVSADEDPEKWGSFGWLVNQGLKAAEGGDVFVDAQCPGCDLHFKVKAWKRPDSNAITKIMEQIIGRAQETQEINITERKIVELLQDETEAPAYEVIALTPEEQERRRQRRLAESNGE